MLGGDKHYFKYQIFKRVYNDSLVARDICLGALYVTDHIATSLYMLINLKGNVLNLADMKALLDLMNRAIPATSVAIGRQ